MFVARQGSSQASRRGSAASTPGADPDFALKVTAVGDRTEWERNLESLVQKTDCRCDVEDPVDADADAVKRHDNIEHERQVCRNISE